jgi:HK97 family phage major capsid protein
LQWPCRRPAIYRQTAAGNRSPALQWLVGIIRLPTELEEDTFIPIGQFLARYIARQFAKLEDRTLFIADGTSTYASQTGVGPYCAANPTYLLQLAGGKTKPSDATLSDFRNLRSKVSAALLSGGHDAAYYMNPTFEPMLRSFNTYPNFVVYDTSNPGKPTFDGWPIRWVGVTQPYLTSAAASTYVAFFGDLTFWYLGERGLPRIEVSRDPAASRLKSTFSAKRITPKNRLSDFLTPVVLAENRVARLTTSPSGR